MTDLELLRQLRAKIDLDKPKWENRHTTNCYAYALGLDVSENDIMAFAYVPGTISSCPICLCERRFFSYPELIESLYSDFDFLGIEFRDISSKEPIDIDEWKIALFTTSCGGNRLEDYHFLRLCKDGIWHHKDGWEKNPTMFDSHAMIIRNPEECFLRRRTFQKCLSLRLKR